MKCRYCKQECELAHLDDITANVIEVWTCNKCPVKVRYSVGHKNQDMSMTCMAVSLGDKKYSVQFLYPQNSFRVTEIMHADEDRLTQRVILELPEIPDITPSNAAKKLPTILTFL